jgi:hypothetical protein
MEKQPIGGCPVCGFFFYEPWEICDCYPKQATETVLRPAAIAGPVAIPWPLIIKGIARRRIDADRGVGDTVERIITKLGGNAFKWIMERVGVDCGCGGRQEWLNAVYPYKDSSDQ